MMSGTSADGIDAALVSFEKDGSFEVLATEFSPFSDEVQRDINALGHGRITPEQSEEFYQLDTQLCQQYSHAALTLLKSADFAADSVSAIANHGQTVAHNPEADPPYSIQLGAGQTLANLSRIPVITQFRQADLAAGGQGAPLMPAFHAHLANSRSTNEPVLVINLGGIANVSLLADPVIGFDTGPANTLMNQWANLHLGESFDKSGQWAASGEVESLVLEQLLEEPYFAMPYPKSTGPDFFNLEWLRTRISKLNDFPPQNIQATLLQLTVESIARAIQQLNLDSGSIYCCGGGGHNPVLMEGLAQRMPNWSVDTTSAMGVPPDWMEAVGFAWLGHCYLNGIPSNLPSVTGAKESVILGERFDPSN